MKKTYFYTGFLVLLFSLYFITELSSTDRQNRKVSVKSKTTASYPARASPADTTVCFVQMNGKSDSSRYSIRMNGQRNKTLVNGKVLVAIPDTTEKENNIWVSGVENTITIIQADQKSKVNISQNGKNNQIKISQTKK